MPDCPSCDSTLPLEPVRTVRGVTEAFCPCCGRRCVIDALGHVVWPVERDVSGEVIAEG